ncbi:hypothetical protein D9758_014785 [Tetrapyrgos nigripes]|uniref:Uncharacterized protein n=1 Tax=Tetrapyrgos nigripes TaxID=182062 RepID=A0A8H5C5S4_9AGAR|nr:hypothetical protein D9758_014785 [Tetrapyrgos nigripes]
MAGGPKTAAENGTTSTRAPKKPPNRWNDKELAALIKSYNDQNPTAEKGEGYKQCEQRMQQQLLEYLTSEGQ